MVVENVIVSKDYRILDLGKIMIDYIENVARGNNCKFIMLVSAISRTEAHTFYASLGYTLNKVKGFRKYLL